MSGGSEHAALSALRCWILSFPQLEGQGDDTSLEYLIKFIEVVSEIYNADAAAIPTTNEEAGRQLHELLNSNGCFIDELSLELLSTQVLSTLLCAALSPSCEHRTTYIERIMGMDDSVQHQLMKIIQERSESDVEDTADYSALASIAESGMGGEESDDELPDSSEILNRSLLQDVTVAATELEKLKSGDEARDDSSVASILEINTKSEEEQVKQLRATILNLQSELAMTRENEHSLTLQIDEIQSAHKAEMIRLESQSMQNTRTLEEKYANEIVELRRQHDALVDSDAKASELKEEVTRLRDELDVLTFSKEKLSYAEEQVRKLKDKLEAIGDAKSALEREEKAHVASVEKCIVLENELAAMKPLKRQLEEYKVRATDAEVALAECRDDLKRLKERSYGLEGLNGELKRGVDVQMEEVGRFQRRLLEGEEVSCDGGVGVGMSELNPELMQELNMLRSEYARLKEFESQREADNVQRMIESCDDAKRLSDRFKEQFICTKGQLEDTQQQLNESHTREAKLREEVADFTERHKLLSEEMKEERIKAHKAALEMERKFNDAKKALTEKARANLQDLENKLTIRLENERKHHKEKMENLINERNEIERRFSQQLAELREQNSANLRSTKEALQQRIDELDQSKRDAIEQAEIVKKAEIEALTNKGKNMLREKLRAADAKAKMKIEEVSAQKNAFKEQLTKLEEFQVDFEEKAKSKISKKTKQIDLLKSQNEASAAAMCDLEDQVKKAERITKELANDNDRLRRQMGSRGPGGASQTQLEELVAVCNSLREENRRLKESSQNNLFADSLPEANTSINELAPALSLGISKAALIEYRQEFEERLQALEDDKRDLIMRNSAAMTDVQKAEARSWELEEELTKIRSELTTTKLAMQRNERRTELLTLGSSCKRQKRFSDGFNKENTPNIHHKARGYTHVSVQSSSKKVKTDVPSLMDHARGGVASNAGEKQECKQS